jgi:hypothetical protein
MVRKEGSSQWKSEIQYGVSVNNQWICLHVPTSAIPSLAGPSSGCNSFGAAGVLNDLEHLIHSH